MCVSVSKSETLVSKYEVGVRWVRKNRMSE